MSGITEFPEDEARQLGKREQEVAGGLSARLPKLSLLARIKNFYQDVKMEMRKTTWPTRTEVWSTTIVVIIAVIFFGAYLAGVDYLITMGINYLQKILLK
jgi:preprotein translocase subunit SecE